MKLMIIKRQSESGTFRDALRRFRKADDGAMIIFSLMMFVLILWFGGMAVDLMRYETARAKLQGSLDRATLAAADLDQVLPPADVVRDYLDKAGMLHFLQGDPFVDEGTNYRIVTAQASAPMPLFFYDLPRIFTNPFSPGMSTINVSGVSTAEERVSDVEISLVLDVSGSMGSNNRITNLRPAARDFVTTVLQNNTNAAEGLITVSMVPYHAVVNPGTLISPSLLLNRTHLYSSCPLFDDALFLTTALDLNAAYDHVAHFDGGWWTSYTSPVELKNPWCGVQDHNAIIPATTNETDLHTAINALVPFGNTAIDMGMKWGVALLDPSTQSLITGLAGVTGTNVPAAAAGRPQAYGMSDVLKIVVLMTDGQNTQEFDVIEPYKSGISPIWFHRQTLTQGFTDVPNNRVSVQTDGHLTPLDYTDDRFYYNNYPTSTRSNNTHPIGYSSQQDYIATRTSNESTTTLAGVGITYANNVHNATWPELFATMRVSDINNTWLNLAYNDNQIPWSAASVNGIPQPNFAGSDSSINYSVVNGSEANARLSDICQAARNQGIVIYTVAFEAPSGGQLALQNCASSPSHYFDVNGTDISAAFSAIASDIRALKLTQ